MESQEIVKSCLKDAESLKTVMDNDKHEKTFDDDFKFPMTSEETLRKPESYQITKCYLCNIDYSGVSESIVNHFKEKHTQIKMKKCEKCEFESEYPW